jgi:hypothetical protein
MLATLVARNTKEAVVGSDGSLKPGGLFCVCAFGRNLALVAMKTFSDLIYFMKTIL